MKTKKTKRVTATRHTVYHNKVASVVPFNSSKLVPLILVTSLLFLFFALLAWVVGIKSKWLSTQEATLADVMEVNPDVVAKTGFWGAIYNDANRNGVLDSGEKGLARGTLFIKDESASDTSTPERPPIQVKGRLPDGSFMWVPGHEGKYTVWCSEVTSQTPSMPVCTTSPNFCRKTTFDYKGGSIMGSCGWYGVK